MNWSAFLHYGLWTLGVLALAATLAIITVAVVFGWLINAITACDEDFGE